MDLECNVKIMERSVQQLEAGNIIHGQGHNGVDQHGAGALHKNHSAQLRIKRECLMRCKVGIASARICISIEISFQGEKSTMIKF